MHFLHFLNFLNFVNFLHLKSVENILFVTEVVQLKCAVTGEPKKSVGSMTRKNVYSGTKVEIRLPRSLPMSVIASEFDSDQADASFYAAARKIYAKYIDPAQAKLEVNISSATRGQFMQIFKAGGDARGMKEISAVLDSAVMEISRLMSHSFWRFMRSDVFRELKKKHDETIIDPRLCRSARL